jgi:TonB family protein
MGLDEKAVEALKKWQFKAASWEGTPVPFETVVRVTFRYF